MQIVLRICMLQVSGDCSRIEEEIEREVFKGER